MISVAHAVTGAFVAHYLPGQPLLYLPLALISHFILDYVTHFDLGVAYKTYKFGKAKLIIGALIDLIMGGILIALIWKQTPTSYNPDLWLGALAGIFPDILQSSDFIFANPMRVLNPLYTIHHRFHKSTANIFWGLLPQVILLTILGLTVGLKQ